MMAWLTRALVLGLLAQTTLAKSPDKKAPAAEAPIANAGSKEDLAYEPISSSTIYTSNATSSSSPSTSSGSGWISTQICAQKTYCIHYHPTLSSGRGIVLVTKFSDFQKIERLDAHLAAGSDRVEPTALTPEGKEPFEESYILNKGPGLTATVPLKRGKPLMEATAVLVVHKDFFADVWRKTERAKMLEKAVSFLPEGTRERFDRQRNLSIGHGRGQDREKKEKNRSVEEILLASPFEIDLGSNSYTPMGQESTADHSKHYVNYPGMALFTHSCRPNIAFHIDGNLALRTTVARKIAPGEELSVAYIDPLKPRKERMEWVSKHRPSLSSSGQGEKEGCPCPACSGHYPAVIQKQHGFPHTSSPAEELAKSDKRLSELEEFRSELRNHESRKVTAEMIEKFLALHMEEGLETKMAEAYELAATNYNYQL